MTYAPILGPVVALVAWTLVVWLWMYATRLPAMRRAGIELKGRVGGRGQNLDGILPDRVQWVSHNYNHLMEQPTLFYAVAISLAILGTTEGAALWLAWGYVGFRVAHSLWQTTVN
ncbi:MAG TPA: MAPEG family protein, partial [Sphingomicrobium sp.]|nr:MAPEG family protein [Sphingomicrobium sp.]